MGWVWVPSRSPRRDLGVITSCFDLGHPPHSAPGAKYRHFRLQILYSDVGQWEDQAKLAEEVIGVKVFERAKESGGQRRP